MPSPATPLNSKYALVAAVIVICIGLAALNIVAIAGGNWMLPSITGVFSALFLYQAVRNHRQQKKAHQDLVQTYLDRLLLAQSADEWQPILNEMASRQLLKGVRLSSSDLDELDLRNADLSHADLSGATLSGANLTGANLAGATFSYATLSYSTLHGAILKGAHLRGVNLRGADLRQTELSGAFLRGAVLSGAALSGANLRGAQLHGANLTDADLRGADLTDAVFTDAILPDGAKWTTCTDMACFTNPDHADFWQTDELSWPVYPSSKLL